MSSNSNNDKTEKQQQIPNGAGIALGVGVGLALGTAMGNIGAGLAIGIAIGAAVTLQNKRNSD